MGLTSLFSPETLVGYVALAVLAGFLGRRRLIGFWGFFFLSLMVTPLVTLFFLFVSAPVKRSPPAKPRAKAKAGV